MKTKTKPENRNSYDPVVAALCSRDNKGREETCYVADMQAALVELHEFALPDAMKTGQAIGTASDVRKPGEIRVTFGRAGRRPTWQVLLRDRRAE